MKAEKEQLSSVLKSTQIGKACILSVLDTTTSSSLRLTLEARVREYNNIENEIHAIASQHGWELKELEPAMRFFSDRKNRIKVTWGNCDSKIADMMIQNSTKGMIRGLRDLHAYPHCNDRISAVSQRLLDCQTVNIRQMQLFL